MSAPSRPAGGVSENPPKTGLRPRFRSSRVGIRGWQGHRKGIVSKRPWHLCSTLLGISGGVSHPLDAQGWASRLYRTRFAVFICGGSLGQETVLRLIAEFSFDVSSYELAKLSCMHTVTKPVRDRRNVGPEEIPVAKLTSGKFESHAGIGGREIHMRVIGVE
jgi:hypothetical protein